MCGVLDPPLLRFLLHCDEMIMICLLLYSLLAWNVSIAFAACMNDIGYGCVGDKILVCGMLSLKYV